MVLNSRKELKARDVDLRLNTEANKENVKELNPEAVFICAGGNPMKPPIKGLDSDKVIVAEDYLEGKREVGNKVAVIGSGATGLEPADTIKATDPNKEVFPIVEMTATLGVEIERNRMVILANLEKEGVKFYRFIN